MKKGLFSLMTSLLLMGGCAANIDSNHYSTSQTGRASAVDQCVVLSVRYVGVNSNTGTGTMLGGIAGGVAGSTIGGGRRANTLGAVGGVLLGSLVGSAAESSLSSQTGLEYVVQLNDGRAISVTQGQSDALGVGQRCLVIYGQQTRIIPN